MKALLLAQEALRILRLDKGDEYRYNVAYPLKEAILELEALQDRSCDGCIGFNDASGYGRYCHCSRNKSHDSYEAKDTQ